MEGGKVIKSGRKSGNDLFLFLFYFILFYFILFYFILFYFILFFCFSLLKTTEICFGSTKIGIFYREKKSGKMTLAPQKNTPVTPLD